MQYVHIMRLMMIGFLVTLARGRSAWQLRPSISRLQGARAYVKADSDREPSPMAKFSIYYNDVFEVKLPDGHRFPMEKYGRVRRALQKDIEDHENGDGRRNRHVKCEFLVSPLATKAELGTTHSLEYIQRFLTGDQTQAEQRNVGFPWSPAGVDRALSSVGGTLAAACDVCEAWAAQNKKGIPPWGAHVAGGTHHAFYDYGEGFCVFSDIAVAANVVLERYPDIKRILIVDLDVHQGNGNAVLFANRMEVSTFSLHCEGNYFSAKQKSDLDVELPIGSTDQTYLATLHHWLKQIEAVGGKYDLIFYQAGVDILADDRLGRLEVSQDCVARRNEMVYDFATRMTAPLVITMGGGYPRKDWSPILDAHKSVYFQAYNYINNLAHKAAIEASMANRRPDTTDTR